MMNTTEIQLTKDAEQKGSCSRIKTANLGGGKIVTYELFVVVVVFDISHPRRSWW